MAYVKFAVPMLLAMAAAAQPPLPGLRVEPTAGGSIFYVHNGSPQPLTAYLIELVNYPGSSYSLWQDDVANPVPPGGDKRIQVANMTVGAVPDYVKMQAAIFADGSSAGVPEKAAQIVERRRASLEATRELLRRCEKGPDRAAVIAGLKEWDSSIPPATRANRNSQAAINHAAERAMIAEVIAGLGAHTLEQITADLRDAEKRLASSKPAL